MKIEVFNDNFKGRGIDGQNFARLINGQKLKEFLKGVKSDLAISYIATGSGDDNLLFKKTMMLAQLVQILWNELEELKG